MLPGTHDAWQIRALVHPTGVRGHSAVAREEHAGITLRRCLLLLDVAVHRTAGVEADVAMRVDQTRQQPAFADRGRIGDGIQADPAIDNP